MAEGDPSSSGVPDPEARREALRAELHRLSAAGLGLRTFRLPPPSKEELERHDYRQDIELKKTYAYWLLALLTLQLLVANGVFVAYAEFGKDWILPDGVIQTWLVATLVELVGVTLVVTRYLFPRRDVSTPE